MKIEIEVLPELLAEIDGIAAHTSCNRDELINLALAFIVKSDRQRRAIEADMELARMSSDRSVLERMYEASDSLGGQS